MGLTRNIASLSKPGQLWGLVDCNNFYASCEKIFRPDLEGKPVVVLSGNDGCIVARSAEAKALGIRMGEPLFKVEQFLKQHDVTIFSSNFALYANISARVMATLEDICPYVQQYSVDEAFIPMTGALQTNAEDVAWELKKRTLRDVAIPVSVAVAPTRTLAKVANHMAKKGTGVVVLRHDADFESILANTPVDDIWGIGRHQAKKCWADGITNALQLVNMRDSWIKQVLTIAGLNTVNELRGIPSIGETLAPTTRKSIVRSQSFGQKVLQKQTLGEAICHFTARAAEDLRREGLVTGNIAVHIRTSRFDTRKQPFEANGQKTLLHPSADTNVLQRAALGILDAIYRDGPEYAKAGIMFCDLSQANKLQGSLLVPDVTLGRSKKLMDVIDKINAKHEGQIKFGAEGMDCKGWQAKQAHLSPKYSTDWTQLPEAKC